MAQVEHDAEIAALALGGRRNDPGDDGGTEAGVAEVGGVVEEKREAAGDVGDGAQRAGVAGFVVGTQVPTGGRGSDLDRFLPAARKLVELLTETRAKLEDDRYQIISAVANMVDRRATRAGNGDLLARYEKTRTYRSAIGVKAAKTREKNSLEQSASAPPA